MHREESESDYAALSASLHGTWGNTIIQAALQGHGQGPAEIIHGAMTLAATGMSVPESNEALFNNSFVNGWMDEHGSVGPDAPVMRRARGESFDQDAASKLDRASKRSGKALPDSVRREMEAAFGGVDFSGVRIHTDATAREAARGIRAEAYTVGQDIFFDENFDVRTSQGRHLLAHELTHVVQHQEGRLRAIGDGLKVSAPTDVVEQEAERMAHAVTAELDAGQMAIRPEAPVLEDAGPAHTGGPQGEGIFRRRRQTPPQNPRDLQAKAQVRARDRRRRSRGKGPKREAGRRLTPRRHEQFNERLRDFLKTRGPELLEPLGWGVPTEAKAKAPKPQKGQAGPEGDLAKGYANWKTQYKEDGRPQLEQHVNAQEDLLRFLEDATESLVQLGKDLVRIIESEDAWKCFTEHIESQDEDSADQGPAQADGDNQENEAHDGLQGHFDANHHKARRHGDGKNENSKTAGAFDSGDDSASGQDDILHGEEHLAGGGDQDAATPRKVDVRRSIDRLVVETNHFIQEFLNQVDGDDITEGTGQGGELAGLQANVSAGGGIQGETGDGPGTDERRSMTVSGSGAALFSKPGSGNPGNVTGRLAPGTAIQASSDNTRPGWTYVTVTDGPMTGQRGWMPSGQTQDQDPGPEHGAPSTQDIVSTIDALLSQGQGGLRQADELIRDPRQSLLKLAGGAMPPAIKETLGETFGWLDKGADAGLDVLGGLQKVGMVQDLDLQRARRTQGLVRQIAGALGLSANAVQVDAGVEGARRTRQAGTRGIQEAGKVFLDPQKYDPSTADGRELLAHEIVHLAQRKLPAPGIPKAGALVEAEAERFAARFAKGGGKLPKVRFGVPSWHRAREGANTDGGSGLEALAAQTQAYCGEQMASMPQRPARPPRMRRTRIIEDREQKVDLYQDGVDGIADDIKGTSAFDALYDAICDEKSTRGALNGVRRTQPYRQLCRMWQDGVDGIADDIKGTSAFDALYDAICDEKSTRGALNGVRRTQPYRQLCRMWQGAKEGGADRGRMMRIFNNEFDGRGFWAETEQAFDMIEASAKRDAKPEPEASMRTTAQTGETQQEEGEEALEEQTEQETAEALDQAGGGAGGQPAPAPQNIDEALQSLMGATVPKDHPAIGAYDTMTGITDAQVDACLSELTHRHSVAGGSQDVTDGRGWQILEAFGENFLGSAFSGFTDQAIDGLVWDNIGFLADSGLKVLTKGGLKTPFVGPLIGLISNSPFELGSWGLGKGGAMEDAGKSWSSFGKSWGEWLNAKPEDKLGLMLAMSADFFAGLRDTCGFLQTFCSTLSAVCLVGGGILILFGLALLWFFGVGAPLVTAGGWACRIGQVLGKVATVFAALTLILAGISAILRGLAAYYVPTEKYAEQLKLVGADATEFGKRTGAKVADAAAETVNDNFVRNKVNARVNDALEGQSPSRGAEGGDEAQRIRDATEADQQRLVEDVDAAQKKVEDSERRRATQEAEQERRRDQKDTDDAEASRAKTKRLGPLFKEFSGKLNVLKTIRNELGGAAAEFGDMFRRGNTGTQEMLASAIWEFGEKGVERNKGKIRANIADLEAMIRQERSREGGGDPKMLRGFAGEIESYQRSLEGLDRQLAHLQAGADAARVREQRMAEMRRREGEGGDDPAQLKRKTQERIEELEVEKAKLSEEQTTKKKALADAEVEDAKAKKSLADAEAELKDYVEGEDYQKRTRDHQAKEQAAHQKKVDDANALLKEAGDLEKQARDARDAQLKRQQAGSIEADAKKAKASADESMQGMKEYEGKRVKCLAPDGEGGKDGFVERKVISIGPDGITMGVKAEHRVSMPLESIKYPAPLRKIAQDYLAHRRQADARQIEADALNAEADAKSPDPSANADQLLADAQRKRTEGEDQKHALRSQKKTRLPDERRDELVRQRRQLRYVEHERPSFRLRRELDQVTSQLQKTDQEIASSKQELEQQKQEQRLEGLQSNRSEEQQSTTSGNAMGGVGSSYKDLAQSILNGRVLFGWATGRLQRLAQTSEHVASSFDNGAKDQSAGVVAEILLEDVMGVKREVGDELTAIGQQQMAREQKRASALSDCLALEPPVTDVQGMVDKRGAATKAYDLYVQSHAKAYLAYEAELAVGKLSAETKALEKSADPVKGASASMSQPLATSRQQEQARGQKIAGANMSGEKPQGGMAGVVAQVIGKFASHGKRFKQAPQFGNADQGAEQVDKAGKAATEDGPALKDKAAKGSEMQRQFLDEAVAERQRQEASLTENQAQLSTKYQHEQQILQGIKVAKAQALAERDQHKAQVESNAAAFNEGFNALNSWREQYVSARTTLESTE